jgi:hypothetical protein
MLREILLPLASAITFRSLAARLEGVLRTGR